MKIEITADRQASERLFKLAVSKIGQLADDLDLSTEAARLGRVEGRAAGEMGEFLHSLISGKVTVQGDQLASRARQGNLRFPVIHPATEKVHRWLLKKYGGMYPYMQRRRAGVKADRDALPMFRDAQTKRTRKGREAATERANRFREARFNRYSAEYAKRELKSKFKRENRNAQGELVPFPGNPGYFAKGDRARRMTRAGINKGLRQGTLQPGSFGLRRTVYYHSGRMAEGLRGAVQIKLSRRDAEDGGINLNIAFKIKNPSQWPDREAGQAFVHMARRPGFGNVLEEEAEGALVDLIEERLTQRAKRRVRSAELPATGPAAQKAAARAKRGSP